MSDNAALDKICQLLTERYPDRDLGAQAADRLRQWLSGDIPFAHEEQIRKHLKEEHLDLLFDAFWQVLPFGTGGRRGSVGYGANRLNHTTVAMTVQGHCQYLKEVFPDEELKVVVANDVRIFKDIKSTYGFLDADHPLFSVSARSLGELACSIYAANGIITYFAEPDVRVGELPDDAAPPVLTTPELSFVIGKLGAHGGINLSASHNPPDDNGIKVYDQFGSQPVAPTDQVLVNAMEKASDIPDGLSYEKFLAEGMIRAVPDELHDEYLETYEKLYENVFTPVADYPITYTPLCGCGLTTVGDTLKNLSFPVISPPDEEPDGTFSVIPFKAPNPEVPQATEPARAYADAHGSGIVISSDPDADRVGLEIKLPDGSWYHFDGNQIAAVLGYYLMIDPAGPKRQGLVMETLVTTKILGRIAEKAGNSWIIDDLLVGFKYVADVLKTLGAGGTYNGIDCSPDKLVLAAEESHGVVMVPTIRDKDATPACMYLAALYQRLCQEGKTLLDYYVGILEDLGGYDSVNRAIMMAGAVGMLKKDRIMESLRADPPQELAGQKVNKFVDYRDEEAFGAFKSETDKSPRNVLQLFCDTFVITIRPSGTEPKLKLYCQLLPFGEPSAARGTELLAEVRQKADATARQIYGDLLAIIDESLDEASLMLPDIIDLDRKLHFEQKTVPELHKRLAANDFSDLSALLDWLRGEAAAMTPGSDPLPALQASMAHICDGWAASDVLGGNALLGELQGWATNSGQQS